MVTGRRNLELMAEISALKRKIRLLKLKPFKSKEDLKKLQVLEEQIVKLELANQVMY